MFSRVFPTAHVLRSSRHFSPLLALFLVSRPLVTRTGVRAPPFLTCSDSSNMFCFSYAVEGTAGVGGQLR